MLRALRVCSLPLYVHELQQVAVLLSTLIPSQRRSGISSIKCTKFFGVAILLELAGESGNM